MTDKTKMDFSKHTLSIEENDKVIIHTLHKDNSKMLLVKFINLLEENILLVTGDFSNWIFCRTFIPNEEGGVSEPYWLEKLRMNSSQKPSEFDSNYTLELIDEILNDTDLNLPNEEIEYYKELKSYIDDEITYMYEAFRNKPLSVDYESIPVGKKINPQLEIVFEAYNEICKRLKEKKEK